MSVYRCPEFTGQPDLLFWSSGDLFPGAPLVRQVGNLLKSVVLPWLRDITGIELNDTINMFAAQYASTGSNAWSLLQFLNEGIMTTNYISKQFIQNLVVFDYSIVDRVGLVLLREFVRHSAQACGSRSPRPVEAGAQGLWRPEPKSFGGRSPRPMEPEPKACGGRSPRPVEAGAQGLWRPEPKACGAGAQAFLDDWSRSQKGLYRGAGAWNLGSGFPALLRAASELCK